MHCHGHTWRKCWLNVLRMERSFQKEFKPDLGEEILVVKWGQFGVAAVTTDEIARMADTCLVHLRFEQFMVIAVLLTTCMWVYLCKHKKALLS